MEISRDITPKTQAIQSVSVGESTSSSQSKASTTGGQVQVSTSAREMQQLLQLAQEAEPIRPDKVDALRQKIESGTYRVDLESVANGMLEDL